MATFEQPLNERIRTFLRLQQLFNRISYHSSRGSEWDMHTSIMLLLDLYDLTKRLDLKSEVMKELERQRTLLNQFAGSNQIDKEQLNLVSNQQHEFIVNLHEQKGQITQHINNNEFLNSVRQRCAGSGSACSYDLPVYYHWLNRSHGECRADIQDWMQPFDVVLRAIDLTLETVRQSAGFEFVSASDGFYQDALSTVRPPQLIRVRTQGNVFPEITGGKHHVTIRFFEYTSVNDRTTQALGDVSFQLAICAI